MSRRRRMTMPFPEGMSEDADQQPEPESQPLEVPPLPPAHDPLPTPEAERTPPATTLADLRADYERLAAACTAAAKAKDSSYAAIKAAKHAAFVAWDMARR